MNRVTTGGVKLLLRVEGACVLVAALLTYSKFDPGWGAFALYFLAPDLSSLGYPARPSIGALAYNTAHSYVGAVLVLLAGILLPAPVLAAAGLIRCAQIGMDRALSDGLEYFTGFGLLSLGS